MPQRYISAQQRWRDPLVYTGAHHFAQRLPSDKLIWCRERLQSNGNSYFKCVCTLN